MMNKMNTVIIILKDTLSIQIKNERVWLMELRHRLKENDVTCDLLSLAKKVFNGRAMDEKRGSVARTRRQRRRRYAIS